MRREKDTLRIITCHSRVPFFFSPRSPTRIDSSVKVSDLKKDFKRVSEEINKHFKGQLDASAAKFKQSKYFKTEIHEEPN